MGKRGYSCSKITRLSLSPSSHVLYILVHIYERLRLIMQHYSTVLNNTLSKSSTLHSLRYICMYIHTCVYVNTEYTGVHTFGVRTRRTGSGPPVSSAVGCHKTPNPVSVRLWYLYSNPLFLFQEVPATCSCYDNI